MLIWNKSVSTGCMFFVVQCKASNAATSRYPFTTKQTSRLTKFIREELDPCTNLTKLLPHY